MASLPFAGDVFALAFVAYNTIFNLPDLDSQRSCFRSVRRVLRAGAAFVVEAFVPDEDDRPRNGVEARSIEIDRVVLAASRLDPVTQTIAGQHVEITASGVRLRPWFLHYLHPGQLDELATETGFALEHRWASWQQGCVHRRRDDARLGLPVCGLTSARRGQYASCSPNSSPGSPRRASRSTTAPDFSVTRISAPNRT